MTVPDGPTWTVLWVVAATARITRLVVTDTIAEPVRAPALRWCDRHGRAGWWLAELLTCPWCVSVWVGAAAAVAAVVAPTAVAYVGLVSAASVAAGLLGNVG